MKIDATLKSVTDNGVTYEWNHRDKTVSMWLPKALIVKQQYIPKDITFYVQERKQKNVCDDMLYKENQDLKLEIRRLSDKLSNIQKVLG
jgi:hypothetical protein